MIKPLLSSNAPYNGEQVLSPVLPQESRAFHAVDNHRLFPNLQHIEVNLDDAPQAEIVSLTIPAKDRYLNIVEAAITALMEREELNQGREWTVYQIVLAAHEVCTNIIEHAYASYPGKIKIDLAIAHNPNRLHIDLLDSGIPFDTSHMSNLSVDEPKTSGYGLFLITQLMDQVNYQAEAGTNHWHLEKSL